MKFPISPSFLAGASALVAGIVLLLFLSVYLFTALPGSVKPIQVALAQVQYDLSSESPSPPLLLLWYSLPFLWLGLGAIFFMARSTSTGVATALVAASTLCALASIQFFGWETIGLFGVPVYFAVNAVRKAHRTNSSTS
jgi:hypothetical protein